MATEQVIPAHVERTYSEMESIMHTVFMRYPVRKAALFGSMSRKDSTPSSDVDLLVEMLPEGVGLPFFALQAELQEVLGKHVDMLTYTSLHRDADATFLRNALQDERVIYER